MAGSSVSFETKLHPFLQRNFPEYPSDIEAESVLHAVDGVEKSIVEHPGEYSDGTNHAIRVLRAIRDTLEADEVSNVNVRTCIDELDFQLKNNLHRIEIQEA